MIISLDEGSIHWYKTEPPMLTLNDKDKDSQKLTVLDEIEQDFLLNIKVGESDTPEHVSYMHYNRAFTSLIMGTSTGVFGRLEVMAEAINDEEEEEENNQKKERRVIEEPFIELGRFHTKRVCGIKELGDSTQIVTISEDHYMTIWEATTQTMLSSVWQPACPTSIDTNPEGTVVFVGTAYGAFRAYDVTNRESPKLVF
jgi:hypothetical protein